MAHAGGRPSEYTEERGNLICSRISTGESLKKICKEEEMPAENTVYYWMVHFPEFSKQYREARAKQAEFLFDELLTIVDNEDGDVNRDRLRVDARKWYLSKVAPKIYGEKLELGGDKDSPLTIQVVNYGDNTPSL